jgi:hypothetical protein
MSHNVRRTAYIYAWYPSRLCEQMSQRLFRTLLAWIELVCSLFTLLSIDEIALYYQDLSLGCDTHDFQLRKCGRRDLYSVARPGSLYEV